MLAVQLRIFGLYLEQMTPSMSLHMDQNRRVARIRELLRENPGWRWMRQYHSVEHYLGYGPVAGSLAAVLRCLEHDTAGLVAPVGSGASSRALLLGLRGSGMSTELVDVQSFGSVTFGSEHLESLGMLIAGDRQQHRVSKRAACAVLAGVLGVLWRGEGGCGGAAAAALRVCGAEVRGDLRCGYMGDGV